jgi:hypothetical protein
MKQKEKEMRKAMMALVVLSGLATQASAETIKYDCGFRLAGQSVKGELTLDWEEVRDPFREGDLTAEGFLTVFTQPKPIRDVVRLEVVQFRRHNTLQGQIISARLPEPTHKGGFFGRIFGKGEHRNDSLSCEAVN